MDAKTLDQLLRARGRAKLIGRIQEAFAQVEGSLTHEAKYGGSGLVQVKDLLSDGRTTKTNDLYVQSAINLCRDKAIEIMSPKAEQDEVDEFIKQVENLGKEVSELKEGLEERYE